VAITVYVALAIEFFVRYFNDRPFHQAMVAGDAEHIALSSRTSSNDAAKISGGLATTIAMERETLTSKLKLMSVGLAFSTLTLFIR
jgi:hypothetical protein